ncbi:MAG: CoA pyrophosphatase, partial [Comamonas sp.]|nr:CoA pyrophosphatase [Comamonas sp.]
SLVGCDSHLPAIAASAQTAQALRQRFAQPPSWQPELRSEPLFTDCSPRPAAVLLPLVQREQGLSLVLTQRSSRMSTHAGQIALPGGRTDPEDPSPTATALREAHEEVGLEPSSAEILGSLPVYATGSAFLVTPVVALVQPQRLTPNPVEVAEIFEVPLHFILNPANHQRRRVLWQDQMREWFAMPYHDEQQHAERFIWGATAGMLRNFYRFMAAPND